MTLIEEAVEKLIHHDRQYVRDAVTDSAVRFEEMSDNGSDSTYAEPARRWRLLAARIASHDSAPADDYLSAEEDDYWWVAAGILWYELNSRS